MKKSENTAGKKQRTRSWKQTSSGSSSKVGTKVSFNVERAESDNEDDAEIYPESSSQHWQGTSGMQKIFSTEVPEDDDQFFEDLDENLQQPYRPSANKGKANVQTTTSIGRKANKSSPARSSRNRKINIDKRNKDRLLFGNLRRSSATESDNQRESSHIIRHRPTVSVKVEPDYFVPKMRRGERSDSARDPRSAKLPPPPKPRKIEEPTSGPIQLPMSVISERHQDQIYTPILPPEELCRFGELYEANFFQLIHKYLEVDTFHRVAYIGQENGSLAPQLEDYFCLTNPVLSVFPGKVDYKDIAEKTKLLAFKISHVGAEEFFARAAEDPAYKRAPFDRVIIHDAVQFFTDLNVTLRNIMKTLHEFGKILIIHRPGSLNTLPYFSDARERFSENDTPYMNIISGLQKLGADVEWDLVHVPIVMPTTKWLAMLKSKFPAQMEIMSNYEIACGLRELSEGPLKYLHGDNMEIEDRLMFITASHTTFDCGYPAVQRIGGASQVPYSGLADVQYRLKLTKDLEQFLPKSKTSQYKMKSLF